VLGLATLFYVLSALEALLHREDWPLSGYGMYADIPGKTTGRTTLVGVSDRGEFPLTYEHTAPFNGARLLSMMHGFSHDHAKRAKFLRELSARYDSQREAEHWPKLLAIRVYKETWVTNPKLQNLNAPKRQRESTLCVVPDALEDCEP
jgi:hypothetical protein